MKHSDYQAKLKEINAAISAELAAREAIHAPQEELDKAHRRTWTAGRWTVVVSPREITLRRDDHYVSGFFDFYGCSDGPEGAALLSCAVSALWSWKNGDIDELPPSGDIVELGRAR